MLKLYDYFRSSAAFRVRLALNYKKIPHEKITINLLDGNQRSNEYLTINPAGLVPSIATDDNNLIHQSLAIIEYLDETYYNNPLLPEDKIARAYVRSLALDVAADTHPLNNLRVLNYLKKELGQSQENVDKWYQHWINLGLSSLEQTIKSSKFYNGGYCYKEQFTLAEIYLLPQLFNAKRFNCDISQYPTLIAIEERCLKHEFVVAAYPEAK